MYQEKYARYLAVIEKYLEDLFVTDAPYGKLQEAMRYSLLAGGKRIRPVLTVAFCRLAGGEWEKAVPLGCALELIHTYSLIHDDLPCMDNDDLRRGKPTNHKVYGETLATLAGDALQPEAYRLIAQAPSLTAEQKIRAVETLALASGGDGMVAGQVLDLEGGCSSIREVEMLHSLKTGAMIVGAAKLGCIAGGADEVLTEAACRYAAHIGMAFQIQDDLLDVIGTTEEFGKPVGSDREEEKTTFVDLLGVEGCGKAVEEHTAAACGALKGFDGSEFLIELAQQLARRRK